MKAKMLAFAFICFLESGLFNGLRPIQVKKVTAQVELRNAAEPHDLILRREAKLHLSKDGPVRRLVCAPGRSFEALFLRQRAPQDGAGGRRLPTLRAGLAVTKKSVRPSAGCSILF